MCGFMVCNWLLERMLNRHFHHSLFLKFSVISAICICISQPTVAAKNVVKVIQDGQLSMEKLPEFSGNVKAFRTDILIELTPTK